MDDLTTLKIPDKDEKPMDDLTTWPLLAQACREWNGGVPFAEIVTSYLRLSGSDQRVLADEFEAAISTVSRWANGIAEPRPKMQKLIVAWIGRYAERKLPFKEKLVNFFRRLTTQK